MNPDNPAMNIHAYNHREFSLITCLFFLSGSAGLVYQVLWMRSLGLFFGSDMHGVALGSLLGERYSASVLT